MNIVSIGHQAARQAGDIGFAPTPRGQNTFVTESNVHGTGPPVGPRAGSLVPDPGSLNGGGSISDPGLPVKGNRRKRWGGRRLGFRMAGIVATVAAPLE